MGLLGFGGDFRGSRSILGQAQKTGNFLLKKAATPGSPRLAIAFSSVNSNSFSFFKLFTRHDNMHVLFVRDPHDDWYAQGVGGAIDGWDRLREAISATIESLGVEHTLAFGSSMGGYAALRITSELELSHCIATSPQTILDPRLPHTPSSRIDSSGYDLNNSLSRPHSSEYRIYLGAADLVDIYNIQRVKWPARTTLLPLRNQDHLAAAHLTRTGHFALAVDEFAEHGTIDASLRSANVELDYDALQAEAVDLIGSIVECAFLGGAGNIRVLTSALSRIPGNWADAYRLASVRISTEGNTKEACEYAEVAARMSPLSITIADTFASTLAAANRTAEAIEAYRRCLAIRPKHYSALCSLAELLARKGEIEQSVHLLSSAIEMRPRLTRAKDLLVQVKSSKVAQENLVRKPPSLGRTLRRLVRRIAEPLGLVPTLRSAQKFLLPSPIAKANSATLDTLRATAFDIERKVQRRRAKLAGISRDKLTLIDRELLQDVEFGDLQLIAGQRRITPPLSVAFLTIANDRFVPGLEGLLLSLLDVYPDLASDVFVLHDGTLSPFVQGTLRQIYPRLTFETPDMSWLSQVPGASGNHRRIGTLGYMNIEVFRKQGYERVIALDSDMLILNDISPAWRGPNASKEPYDYVESEHVLACNDIGVTPYAATSPVTKRRVINSGLISLPNKYINEQFYREFAAHAARASEPVCDLLDRFADQKVWNLFLADKDVKPLPLNFNCNARYLETYMDGDPTFVSVLHFTGPKPWFSKDYLSDDEISFKAGTRRTTAAVWRAKFSALLAAHRGGAYRQHRSAHPLRRAPDTDGGLDERPACFFIGNGPSLASTDLGAIKNFERFTFNWFVNHPEFDEIKPQHLVLASHMLFGGWRTQRPALPPSFLDQLYTKRWRPKLWTSYYFKPYMDEIGLSRDFEVDYFLFEKPFKKFIDHTGRANLDINTFCLDGRTGVLSAALPIAIALGYERFGLVGCDSNYNRAGSSNYFYDAAQHQSASTREESLTSTWTDNGPGHYCYTVAQRELELHGMSLVDFTIGGSLPLSKGDWDSLALPGQAPSNAVDARATAP